MVHLLEIEICVDQDRQFIAPTYGVLEDRYSATAS